MPEMPEVETARRKLALKLPGLRIIKTEIFWPRTIHAHTIEAFTDLLAQTRFLSCERRAKYLQFPLSNQHHLLVHLRMSGDLIFQSSLIPAHKHARVYLTLEDGNQLRFNDPRKFGRMYLTKDPEKFLANLGPEPLAASFTPLVFKQQLSKTSRPIKVALLDQSLIAGLGNIYAIESLWHAGIDPQTSSCKLTLPQTERLHAAVQQVLTAAINAGGTDLGDGVWKHGDFKTYAYGKEGLPCSRCQTPLKHIVMAQRGTDFCPRCQK